MNEPKMIKQVGPTGAVYSSLKSLDEAVAELAMQISAITDALHPILQADGPSVDYCAEDSNSPRPAVPLSDSIDNATGFIAEQTRKLRALNRRISI